MRQRSRWMWIAGAPALIAGCAVADDPTTSKTAAQPLQITPATRISTEGILPFGGTVFGTNPTTKLEGSDFHGYEFDALAGANITIKMTGSTCGLPDTQLDLFGPEDANGNRAFQFENDDVGTAPCTFDSQITGTILATGRFLIVATSFLQQGGGANGHYTLTLTCNNNACVNPAAPSFAKSKILQTDIDKGLFTPSQLFDIGDFVFEHDFQVAEGLGNALAGAPGNGTARPAFRNIPNNVHFAAFGAPEAQSCVTCHNQGGDDGGGDLNHNIFQIGDGINRSSGVERNPPPLLGSGLRQRIGEEMTAELQGQLAAGKTQAKNTKTDVTVNLTSKTRKFGSVVAHPDGTVDFTNLFPQVVDTDLVVKPFGWKGREATIRRFIEGGFRVHFGIQSDPQVKANCPVNGVPTGNVNLLGTANCPDPDGDGVTGELPEGTLSAEAVYMGLRETPVRIPAINAAAQARVNQGEALFNQVGCQNCHTQNMTINVPTHVEPADTTGGAGIRLNLATDTKSPHPALNADGSMTVEIWSDFRRHDMGPGDCDSKNFNQIGACFFITPPLWGIRNTAPYLHDGRAATLQDSILLHGDGDDADSIADFKALSADDQQKIVEFMNSLGRQEDLDAIATPVDLSGFILEQLQTVNGVSTFIDAFLPANTKVKHGGFLIVARNATQAQFEAFYCATGNCPGGTTLGPNAVFVTGGNAFPVIDGSETFAAFDFQGVFMDGRSFPEATAGLQTLQRTNCNAPANLAASWNIRPTSTAIATPGRGPLSTGQNHICVSEVADATNTNFEFIEVFVE